MPEMYELKIYSNLDDFYLSLLQENKKWPLIMDILKKIFFWEHSALPETNLVLEVLFIRKDPFSKLLFSSSLFKMIQARVYIPCRT